jgi:hypothetical protein
MVSARCRTPKFRFCNFYRFNFAASKIKTDSQIERLNPPRAAWWSNEKGIFTVLVAVVDVSGLRHRARLAICLKTAPALHCPPRDLESSQCHSLAGSERLRRDRPVDRQ